mmetsp:Transcript_30346/g.91878  ORF Transcript_30346/g.91878 Transcript_30346/m.91878 type:complete len:216 (-) Transcript_30346:1058-1705(-)
MCACSRSSSESESSPEAPAAPGTKLQAACTMTAHEAVYITFWAQDGGCRLRSCMARRRTAIITTQSMGTKAKARCTAPTTEAVQWRVAATALHRIRPRQTAKYTTVSSITQLMAADTGNAPRPSTWRSLALRGSTGAAGGSSCHIRPSISSMATTLTSTPSIPTYKTPMIAARARVRQAAHGRPSGGSLTVSMFPRGSAERGCSRPAAWPQAQTA